MELILRALLLKVLDDVVHCRKAVDATNPILCSFNAKQVADRGMGLDEAYDHLALGKFSMEIQEHLRAREIHHRRGGEITNDEAERFALSCDTIEHDSQYVVDVEVENRGLDAEGEYAGDLFVVPVPCEIREAASARDAAQESDVRPRRVMEEQQD